MTLPRLFSRCLLRPEDLRPSQPDLSVVGVFNPGAVATPTGMILLVRVAERVREERSGFVGLPRWDIDTGQVVTDWLPEDEVTFLDARVVKIKQTGLLRLTFTSHLRVVQSPDGRSIGAIAPQIWRPSTVTEEYGLEDPRITPLDGRYYITYVAVSRHGAATALASTQDFQTFERHGIIFCPENKDVILFPERIRDQYVALHRPTPAHEFSRPEMWLASSADLLHWGNHLPFLGATSAWDIGRVGAGTPPIRTAEGWLAIYHGNDKREGDAGIGLYSGGLLLLDLDQPQRILRIRGQVFVPEQEYECQGFVPNVVFPTGIVEQGETVLVYYGAADSSTGVVELRLSDLLGQ
jgi:beta-1,2-mannobiose phosphorylase / 1,2-beta-oligomannan phosphorylase